MFNVELRGKKNGFLPRFTWAPEIYSMCNPVPLLDEVFRALAPNKEDLQDINESFKKTSFKSFPTRLGQQHAWLDVLSNLTCDTKKAMRQNKGYSLIKKNQERALYEKLYYLGKLRSVLEESAGDLANNEYALLYEFNVLLVAKWMLFKDSKSKFEKLLSRMNAL